MFPKVLGVAEALHSLTQSIPIGTYVNEAYLNFLILRLLYWILLKDAYVNIIKGDCTRGRHTGDVIIDKHH